jgi:NADPH:quinone reductase
MRAAALDQFAGVQNLHVKELLVSEPGPDEMLLRVESAGVGVWDHQRKSARLPTGGEADLPDFHL